MTLLPVIRLGDSLSPHGGVVLEGRYDFFGKPAARLGDLVRCKKHGRSRIAEGSSIMLIDAQPVALAGHRCGCGCRLVSSLPSSQLQVAPWTGRPHR